MNVMLASSAGSQSNDLLQAQLTHDRFYDARRMVARSFTDSLLFVASSKFGCGGAELPAPPADPCTVLQPSNDVIIYAQNALSKMNDSVANVSWILNPVNCTGIAGQFNVTQDVWLLVKSPVAKVETTKHYWRQLTVTQLLSPLGAVTGVTITIKNYDDPGGAFGIQTASIKVTC
jgi:hypothetical protein